MATMLHNLTRIASEPNGTAWATENRIPYRMEHVLSYRLGLDMPPEIIGPTPEGLRVNFYFTGGTITGPRMDGTILPVGGEWFTVRPDGVGILDMRATYETNDGATIYAPFYGVLDLGEQGYKKLLEGRFAPNGTPFKSVPRYVTAHPQYQWLNRLQCVGIGQAFPSQGEIRSDVYALI